MSAQVEIVAGLDEPTEIPIIDIGPYLAGDSGALEKLAAELRHAQENVGFYFIVNHGVPRRLVSQAYDQLRRLFDLPLEEKLKLRINENSVGYVPAKSTIYVTSTVNKNTQPDLNETLLTVRERAPDHPSVVANRRFHGPNQWPDEALVPGYREKMLEYYAAVEALAFKMLPVYARALDLPADYFEQYFADPMWSTRNSHYPAVAAEDNQFGISPHRDHGFITFLPLSEEPGLQILTQSGRWMPAEQVEGAFIVNTGEFMNRWTNGRFIATPHRVVPPNNDRYSVAFFFNPTWDTLAVPLPTCVSEDNPARFEPMRMIDYLAWYLDRNFSKQGGGRQEDYAADEAISR
jgi:isopenicillin N synthase-like dioxygenase